MPKLSPAEIAEYAHRAGFRGEALRTAVAVALAESSGDTHAHNGVAPDNSYGLWQINMLGAMGPERREQFGIDHNAALFRPAENAAAAYAVSGNGGDFGPWSTYTNGSYRQYLDEARHGVRALDHKGGHRPDDEPKHHKGGNDHRRGPGRDFAVDLDTLHTFTTRTHQLSENLRQVASGQLGRVRVAPHENPFGGIGHDSGFAAALNDFGDSIRYQTRGLAHNASTFADGTREVGAAYRDHELKATRSLEGAVHGGTQKWT
jgi:lysozyme-like protein